MKFTAIKRSKPKIDFLMEGVRMAPSAYKNAIDSNKVKIGFELEFLIGKQYQDYTLNQVGEVLDKFEDNRRDFTKKEFSKYQHLMKSLVVKNMLAKYLCDKLGDVASGISSAYGELNEFTNFMRDDGGSPFATTKQVVEHIVDKFMAVQKNEELLHNHNYRGPIAVPRLKEHIRQCLMNDVEGFSEQDVDDFNGVLYRCDLSGLFENFNVLDLTDDAFEDIFVFGLRDDDDFQRLFISKAWVNRQESIAEFLEHQTGITIKSVSDKYAGATRSFNSGTHGYYLEIDGEGPELISDPMPMNKALEDLTKILACIDTYFKTDSTRGLHINVSLDGLQTYNIDLMKLLVFLGEDHLLQQFDREANDFAKPQMRNFMRFFSKYSSDKENFNKVFMNKNQGQYRTLANAAVTDFITRSGTNHDAKYHTFNPLKLFGDTPYLEFRIMGNEGYEKKFDEIHNQILRYVYAITLAMDENAERPAYAKKLWRMVKDFAASNARPSDFDDFMKNVKPENIGYKYTNTKARPADSEYPVDGSVVSQFSVLCSIAQDSYVPVWDGKFFISLNKLKEYGVGSKKFDNVMDTVVIYMGLALIFISQKKTFNLKQRNVWKSLTQGLKERGIPIVASIPVTLEMNLFPPNVLRDMRKPGSTNTLEWAGKTYTGHELDQLFKLVESTMDWLYDKG